MKKRIVKKRGLLVLCTVFAFLLINMTVAAQVDDHVHDYVTTGVCSCGFVQIGEKTFPNKAFREGTVKSADTDNDGILSTAELDAVSLIDVTNVVGVNDLTGIGYFTKLTELICPSKHINSLDLSKNTELVKLVCNNNNLNVLNLTANTKLEILHACIIS